MRWVQDGIAAMRRREVGHFASLHFASLHLVFLAKVAAAGGLILSEYDNTDTPLHTCKQSSRSRALLPPSTEHVSVARRVHAM